MIRLTEQQWVGTLWALVVGVLVMALLASSWLIGAVAILAGNAAAVTTFAWRTAMVPSRPAAKPASDLPPEEQR